MNEKWARAEGDKNVYASNPGRIVCIKPSKYLPFDTQAQNNAQWEKDARLIAAAPELLEALELLEAVDFGANGSVERGARMARIAITKAKGD